MSLSVGNLLQKIRSVELRPHLNLWHDSIVPVRQDALKSVLQTFCPRNQTDVNHLQMQTLVYFLYGPRCLK